MSRHAAIFLAFTTVPALGATVSSTTEVVAEQRRELQAAGEVKIEVWIGDDACAVTGDTFKFFDANYGQGTCFDNNDGTSAIYSCDGCTVKDKTYTASSTCTGSYEDYEYASGYCFFLFALSAKITCPGCGGSDDDPCFAKESTHAVLKSGERVLMSSLRAGDLVKDGPNSYTRVVVNQHAAIDKASSLINVEHTNGSLALTPDHSLFIDGKLGAARDLKTGSMLGDAQVLSLSMATGAVINPITVSGKILAVGQGEPVVAAAHPEWIAQYLLDSYVPLPVSLSNLLSYLFPATTQDYYDEHLEKILDTAAPQLKQWKAALPTAAIPAAVAVVDAAISAGFVTYALSSPKVAIGLAAVFVGKKLARKA